MKKTAIFEFSVLKTTLLSVLVLLLASPVCMASDVVYVLDISIDTDQKSVSGTANISSPAVRNIALNAGSLENLTVNGRKTVVPADGTLVLEIGKSGPTTIRYEADFKKSAAGHIDTAHAFLLADWYPVPDEPVNYTLSVTLPRDFKAVSEAESVSIAYSENQATHLFHFPHPLDGLHLAASSNYEIKQEISNDVLIQAYFFKQDIALADSYIEHARKYLKYFGEILGPYPYKRFAIVENVRPTGYSMPTYTLLGRDVVKLPFIVKTSLPHEIVHQWFGNHVYIDSSHGNWAEGLTTYLADHQLEAEQGKGSAYRKKIMIDNAAYVNPDNAMPVSSFQYRRNKAQAAVGYGRTAMIFHGLKTRFGQESFYAALRGFIENHRFRPASWEDVQKAFEIETGKDLHAYFDTWLNRADLPELTVESSDIEIRQGQPTLTFGLIQHGDPFPLDIPVQIHTSTCVKKRTAHMDSQRQDFSIPLEGLPTKVVLDESYDIMRHLAADEHPPVLAAVMGKQKLTAVVGDEQRAVYQPLAEALGVTDIDVAAPDDISFSSVRNSTLLICGSDNPLAHSLLGSRPVSDSGLSLTVFKHPYNDNELILLAHAENRQESLAVKHKLRHYGKYTSLTFNRGRIADKHIAKADNGILVIENQEVLALQPGRVPTLEQVKDRLLDTRIVFVGEKHDRYAHHMNQLEIIRHLHASGAEVAVGMEMFHQPYQKIVDDYLAGRIDERIFLKESHYYDEWRYDFGLYKPIVDFIKENNIPLIALNIPGDITRQVARQGIESLDGEYKAQLPVDLDFSNRHYRKDLKSVFELHGNQGDIDDFSHFFQAQVLWDESMAERASRYLIENPAHKLVILAGNGHIRHGHGIPDRLFRRSGEPFTIIVQDEALEKQIADYVLLTTEIKGERSPRLGVSIEAQDSGLTITGVSKNSPAEQAGLKTDDVIKGFDGNDIADLADLKIALYYSRKDQTYSLDVLRSDQIHEMDVTLFEFRQFQMHKK